jgi:uncharacterized protein (TIGR02145 family)
MSRTINITFLFLFAISISCSNSASNELSESVCGNVTDIDGNTYTSVKIDDKCWFSQNLNVSKYKNGDIIPEVQNSTQWTNLTTGAWCYAYNDAANGIIYGKLYNWYAVNDPRGLAPEGWHIPTQDEWISLKYFLSGNGGELKEVGSDHWMGPNTDATDSYGFHALPSGYRSFMGDQFSIGYEVWLWSSTNDSNISAFFLGLSYNNNYIDIDDAGKPVGMAVRCVKD